MMFPRTAVKRASWHGKATTGFLSLLLALPVAAQQQPDNQSQTGVKDAGAGSTSSKCEGLPEHGRLTKVLRDVVEPKDKDANGGLGNHMWAVVVNRAGVVCTVSRSGEKLGDQWPGSRGIAAAKAFTANGFSLPGFALSTANVFWPSQPQNSLYALEAGNPVEPDLIYRGQATNWGTVNDPLVGERAGGTIVFAGGLALYNPDGELVDAVGLSGDQSCTDHVIAWKLRHRLNLDNVPKGVTKAGNDNIIYDIHHDPSIGGMSSTSGYGHPTCSPGATRIAQNFDETHPTGPKE
ncbi:MAG: hypothetical protein CL583_12180 [Alteromonadaceae bacterium]|nr:hypothetical protein [Alteromonadaceae bacterium]|tara:strand:- start:1769 stop:2647 length:879 start_codon:yes stop_codon:yes gene_type:complete